MPVDRRLRDELAHVLAVHMRDGTQVDRLFARLRSLHDELASIDAAAADIADDVLLELECNDDRETLGSLQEWDTYRRRIAFLLSDLSLPPRESVPRLPPPNRTLARGLLVAMIVSLAVAPWAKAYAFFACWILSPAIWLIATTRKTRSTSSIWPFESEAQWRAHQPLLETLHLPAWTDSPHYRRPIPPWRRAISAAVTKVLLFGAVYLLTATVWPLSVIAMSFPRDVNCEHNPRVATR
jgi:hypothetical protein